MLQASNEGCTALRACSAGAAEAHLWVNHVLQPGREEVGEARGRHRDAGWQAKDIGWQCKWQAGARLPSQGPAGRHAGASCLVVVHHHVGVGNHVAGQEVGAPLALAAHHPQVVQCVHACERARDSNGGVVGPTASPRNARAAMPPRALHASAPPSGPSIACQAGPAACAWPAQSLHTDALAVQPHPTAPASAICPARCLAQIAPPAAHPGPGGRPAPRHPGPQRSRRSRCPGHSAHAPAPTARSTACSRRPRSHGSPPLRGCRAGRICAEWRGVRPHGRAAWARRWHAKQLQTRVNGRQQQQQCRVCDSPSLDLAPRCIRLALVCPPARPERPSFWHSPCASSPMTVGCMHRFLRLLSPSARMGGAPPLSSKYRCRYCISSCSSASTCGQRGKGEEPPEGGQQAGRDGEAGTAWRGLGVRREPLDVRTGVCAIRQAAADRPSQTFLCASACPDTLPRHSHVALASPKPSQPAAGPPM